MPPERRKPRPLAIDSSHHLFRITGTRRDALRRKLIWSRKVLRRERHVERRCILLEIFAALRAGIGTISSLCASTQASASCAGVQRFSFANASTRLTSSRFRAKFSP